MSTLASEDVTLSLKEGEEPGDSDEELTRKMSGASFYSTDGGQEDDEDAVDNDDDRKDAHVVLGPQLALKEQLEMDKDDESLRKWNEQLLADVDLYEVGGYPNPEVTIQSITIITSDRPDVVLPIHFDSNAGSCSFTLKLGRKYRLRLSFIVSNNVISGLRYMSTLRKVPGFIIVESTTVKLRTFSPQNEPYTYELEDDTSSGIFSLGSYFIEIKLVDDEDNCHFKIGYNFNIIED